MAERKRIVVKSTKKSAISKVEVITVQSNDVPSLTARHPVGVVVAERRIPSKVSHSEQEPRPIFLPGCLLPQVLPPESQATNQANQKKEIVTKVCRPTTYRVKKNNFDVKLRKPSKTVTFKINDDNNAGRIYNPKDYTNTSQDSRALRQDDTSSAGSGTYSEENRTSETFLTGPPRYILVSKGVKKEIDPDSGDNGNDISTADSLPVQNSSENSSVQSGLEEYSASERKDIRIRSISESDPIHGNEDYISSFSAKVSEMSSSDTVDSNNPRVYSETTSNDENQELSTSESMGNGPPSDNISMVIPVKHGSLRVRQKPHVIGEIMKDIENQDSKLQNAANRAHHGGIRNMNRVNEKKTAKRGVIRSSDLSSSSRTVINHGTLDGSGLGASNIRMGTRGRARQLRGRKPQPRRWCFSCSLRPEPDQKGGAPRQIRRAEGKGKETKPLKHSCSHPTATTSARSSPRSSPRKASSPRASSLSPPRVPVTVSVSSPPRAMSISPPTTLSPTPSVDQTVVPPTCNEGGEASKIKETSEGTNIAYLKPFADTGEDKVTSGISMEELETVPQWLASVRDELRRKKGLGDLLDAPTSRLSSIIQGLSSGTFDEDKYIISQRVDQYVSKACRNAVRKVNEGQSASPPPILPMTSRYPLWPPDPIAQPTSTSVKPSSSDQDLRQQHPPAHLLSHPKTYPPALLPTKPLPQAPTQPVIHPPPLFMHSQIKREPCPPLEPLQNYVRKSGRHHKKSGKVHTTNLKKEDSQSHKGQEKDDIPAHFHPDTSEKNEAEDLAPEFTASVIKTEKTDENPKLKLQISTQASVHIPRKNVTESLPGISISPREPPLKQSQKYKVVEVIHRSINEEEPSFSSDSSKAEVDLSDNTHRSDEIIGDQISDTRESRNDDKVDVEGSSSPSCDAAAAEINIDSEENDHSQLHSDHHLQEDALDDVAAHMRGENEEENCNKIQSDDKQQKKKKTGEPNIVYLVDYNDTRGDSVRHQDPVSKEDGDEDSKDEEKEETLPGYMPQTRWEEMTVENDRCEDTVEYTREMLLEAEDRLHQHDLQLRILQRLEERLRDLVQVEQISVAADPEAKGELWPGDAHEDEQNTEGNDQDAQKIMAAARAVLGSLVCERLDAARKQVGEDGPRAPTNISEGATSSSHTQSKYESSFSSEAESSSSTRQELVPESTTLQQVQTPSPSPPPEVESPGRQLLTPQISFEEDEDNREVIATPPSSPPPSSAALIREKPLTPSTTPASSPLKLMKIVTPEYTPTESPLHSGNTVVHVDTPRQSPLPQQVAGEMVDVPATPTPSALSPVHPESVPVLHPVPLDITTSSQESQERPFPRLLDQGVQANLPDRRPGYMEDMKIQVIQADSRDLYNPETPSVICQSLSDVTVSSSVETPDMTCYTVSEGEVIAGAMSTNISLEAGEAASAGCLHLLTSYCRD